MTTTPTTEALTAVLGEQVFQFGFPTMEAAQRHAADRIAQGRPAVTFTTDEGVHVCAYGVKGAGA